MLCYVFCCGIPFTSPFSFLHIILLFSSHYPSLLFTLPFSFPYSLHPLLKGIMNYSVIRKNLFITRDSQNYERNTHYRFFLYRNVENVDTVHEEFRLFGESPSNHVFGCLMLLNGVFILQLLH